MSRLSLLFPRKIDVPFFLTVIFLTAVGIGMIYSTTVGTVRGDLWSRQLFFSLLGLVVVAILISIDYRILLQYSPWIYGASLAVLVYLPLFGSRIAGAKSWIRLWAGFQMQPSEFVKLSAALLLAWILENDDRQFASGKTVALIGAATMVPVILIMLQPDLGVALTYIPMALSALFFGGLRARWWILLILIGMSLSFGSWFFLKEYQKDRIRTFLDPELAAQGAGYQVRQARIAIGSGGIAGKGWLKGSQSRLGFLPVRHTDFIFAALAEEWGFLGISGILSAYGLLLSRGFAIARDARDRGGMMLILILSVNVTVEALVNIAMNVGVVPTTGITLPFISYGGSSLLSCWGAAGLCLSVAYRRFVNV